MEKSGISLKIVDLAVKSAPAPSCWAQKLTFNLKNLKMPSVHILLKNNYKGLWQKLWFDVVLSLDYELDQRNNKLYMQEKKNNQNYEKKKKNRWK